MIKRLFITEAFIVIALLIIITALLSHSYLLFHINVEFFSIVIAFSLFVFGWNTKDNFQNSYLLVISVAYLFVGILDMVHTLGYKGMNIFTNDPNFATQLWIIARFIEASTFIVAYKFVNRKISGVKIVAIYAIITTVAIVSVVFGYFPDCYINGVGLTTFKVVAEYIICGILILSLTILQKSKNIPNKIKFMLSLALIVTIVSELCFTLYVDIYGALNIIGHILKVISFYLLYRAILVVGIQEPMEILTTQLEETKEDNRLKEELLLKQSRVASMGEMVSAIAHHWRQPLNVIAINVQNIQDMYDFGELTKESLEQEISKIMTDINNMSENINNLLGIIPINIEDTNHCTVEEIKLAYEAIKAELIYSDIEVKANLFNNGFKNIEDINCEEDNYQFTRIVSSEFRQVIFNILLNARDAILVKRAKEFPNMRGRIDISVLFENSYEKIIIEDNGIGFDSETLNRVFEPFFTTKERGQGKGVITGVGTGLYVAKIVVEEHMGGKIMVNNGFIGARVIITIPIIKS